MSLIASHGALLHEAPGAVVPSEEMHLAESSSEEQAQHAETADSQSESHEAGTGAPAQAASTDGLQPVEVSSATAQSDMQPATSDKAEAEGVQSLSGQPDGSTNMKEPVAGQEVDREEWQGSTMQQEEQGHMRGNASAEIARAGEHCLAVRVKDFLAIQS